MFARITANGVFGPGETRDFIIDTYSSAIGIGASACNAIGVESGFRVATNQLPAIPAVPSLSPLGTALLGGLIVAMGVGRLAMRRRRRVG